MIQKIIISVTKLGYLPKYKINPLMQMGRYMLALKSHSMLMNEINWVFSPRRKFNRI